MIENAIRVEDTRQMQSYQLFSHIPPDQMHLLNNSSGQRPTAYLYLELSAQPVSLTINLGALSPTNVKGQSEANQEE